MPNANSPNSAVAVALSMIQGHHRFLTRNTGVTNNGQNDHYVLNPQGVLSNNRHFINKTSQEYQPNGDGTTEGQSLLVLGYIYAYLATKNQVYLDAAKTYWDAYVAYFYAGQAIPSTPQRWIANWIVNAKEPILANYPLNTTEPTEGGFQGVQVAFTAGLGQIPASGTTWGQYLDKATFAYVGVLGWNSIVASVYADNGSGGPNYDTPGTKYDVDWIIAWSGDKIDSNGDIIGTGFTSGDFGKVQLKNTSITGTYKLNYTTRQPTANGGYLIGRNEVQHNRPMHVPVQPTTVAFNRYRMSNAADGEEWFADASYLLWEITGITKYKQALDCVLFTLREFASITGGANDPEYGLAYQKSTTVSDPFALNNSYDFTYPSGVSVTYSRDGAGYVNVTVPVKAELTWETVFDTPIGWLSGTYWLVEMGVTPSTKPVLLFLRVAYQTTVGGPLGYWEACIEPFGSPFGNNISGDRFFQVETQDGGPAIWASYSRTDWYGGGVLSRYWFDDVFGMAGQVVRCTFPNDSAGMVIDFADQTGGTVQPISIHYACDTEFDIRIKDDNGWRWYWIVPSTGGDWSTYTFDQENMVLSGYQPDGIGQTPSTPVFTRVADFTIILENDETNKYFEYFLINEVPAMLNQYNTGYIAEIRLTMESETSFTAKIGNLKVMAAAAQPVTALAYTPGVIPFSNVYDVTTGALDSTNGLPYPGYQYPMIWSISGVDATRLTNMVDFLHASQAAYDTLIGELGPVASAYVWDIPSNTQYGTANTFTMYHWGSDVAWSGYQARAFQAGARAMQELVYRDEDVPVKLTQYLNNWVTWLDDYYTAHGIFPTDFPADAVAAPLSSDFTGHMTGLFLAGLCLCELGNLGHPKLRRLQNAALEELRANYVITSVPGHAMNCAWSGSVSTVHDNSQFFGFWAGEILRGLGLYALLHTRVPSKDLYA